MKNYELTRKSNRLSSWDYGANANYFITICTKNKHPYFGIIDESVNRYSDIAKYAIKCWESIPKYHSFIELGTFMFMPDHMHGILTINYKNDSRLEIHPPPQSRTHIGNIIRGFKSAVKSYANKNSIDFIWQSRFYDHIIRNPNDLKRIQKYIKENPSKYHSNPR